MRYLSYAIVTSVLLICLTMFGLKLMEIKFAVNVQNNLMEEQDQLQYELERGNN